MERTNERRRLTKHPTDSHIFGVCGGLGHYFGIDPNVFRAAFVILAAFGGGGVLVYVLLGLFLPDGSEPTDAPLGGTNVPTRDTAAEARDARPGDRPRDEGSVVFALVLFGAGAYLLVRRIGIDLAAWMNAVPVVPALLMAIGAYLLWRHWNDRA